MLVIKDELAGEEITFYYAESGSDCRKIYDYAQRKSLWAFDTESTGLNCYHHSWELRTFQFGDKRRSFVIPAKYRRTIAALAKAPIRWVGHNGPHDVRSVDAFLGYETGMFLAGETYLPAHHFDPRKQDEGGVGHGLKEQCIAHIDRQAGKWEIALKKEFKKIEIPIPGEVYKSGKKKGQPKVRKAKISEGWRLIDPTNPKYIAYAAADPILTAWLWNHYYPVVKEHKELYEFDHRVQMACDRLHRRGMPLDIHYTKRFKRELNYRAVAEQGKAAKLGCKNIYSSVQIENALRALGADFHEKTAKGAYKMDEEVLKSLLGKVNADVDALVNAILTAKRVSKRREAYADAMLREVDPNGRIHPSINSLAARTARMSVSSPALQQLPTRENEEGEE